jgi:integrase
VTQLDGTKKRLQGTSPVNTKVAAEAHERHTVSRFLDRSSRGVAHASPTLRDFHAEFLSQATVNNKESEVAGKRIILNRHLLPALGHLPLDQIGLRDVERLKATLIEGRQPKTVNNILAVLGRVLSYAVEVGQLEKKPRIKLLHVPPQPFEFLEEPELTRLLQACRAPDERLAVLLAAEAGLRRGELLALHWEDADLVSHKLVIRRAYWNGRLGSPKGRRERVVPMTSRVHAALTSARHLGETVLVREDGTPWTVETARWLEGRIWRRSKLTRPSMPWHALRHTFGARLARAGAPPRAIQELMGHVSINTTMRYMHLAPSRLQEAVSLLEPQATVRLQPRARTKSPRVSR